jgi:hypothetical protein
VTDQQAPGRGDAAALTMKMMAMVSPSRRASPSAGPVNECYVEAGRGLVRSPLMPPSTASAVPVVAPASGLAR